MVLSIDGNNKLGGQIKKKKQELNRILENRSLLDQIRETQLNWMGHVLQYDGLLRSVFESKIHGK